MPPIRPRQREPRAAELAYASRYSAGLRVIRRAKSAVFLPQNHEVDLRWRQMNTSRLLFRFAYLLGFKPWDSGISPPELVEWVEGPKALPPGRALDIGCGTGTNCKYLLDHKWDVTGVDFVAQALNKAKLKAP